MMSLNDNEKDFQKKLQEETEIPVIVHGACGIRHIV